MTLLWWALPLTVSAVALLVAATAAGLAADARATALRTLHIVDDYLAAAGNRADREAADLVGLRQAVTDLDATIRTLPRPTERPTDA
jgi:hypothetical protein